MAKGMVDSGYQPENDILFVCHGAEEWGAIGSQYDWTTGAWEMIHTAHPEWAGKTIAMLNFELPGTYDGAQQWQVSCVPEFANVVAAMAGEDGVFTQPINGVYPQGLDPVSVDTNTQEDGISYRWHGVPYFINIPGFEGSWARTATTPWRTTGTPIPPTLCRPTSITSAPWPSISTRPRPWPWT